MKLTAGVMAARGILNNPAMYAGYNCTPLQCVRDWVSFRGRIELFKYSYTYVRIVKYLIRHLIYLVIILRYYYSAVQKAH